MLLVIDVGNTNIVMGVYNGAKLVEDWRVRTESRMTEDEFNVLASQLFSAGSIPIGKIKRTVISCVVPPMVEVLCAFCSRYLGHKPLVVDARNSGCMLTHCDNSAEVGADRIVNGVAAFHKYGQSLIVIDFGTATTFDVISHKGEYLGGAISPGIYIAAEALFRQASKLPRVEIFAVPQQVIGKNTINSMQSGIIYGYASLVDGMVRRIKGEMQDTPPRVIATGGLAPLMKDVAHCIDSVDPNLTLEGLRIISESLPRRSDG